MNTKSINFYKVVATAIILAAMVFTGLNFSLNRVLSILIPAVIVAVFWFLLGQNSELEKKYEKVPSKRHKLVSIATSIFSIVGIIATLVLYHLEKPDPIFYIVISTVLVFIGYLISERKNFKKGTTP